MAIEIRKNISSETRFQTFLADKRVALVGPSLSIIGSGYGSDIEQYDLVVRMNHHWPIDPGLVSDVGSRMDILYHCCNGDHPVKRLFTPGFSRTQFVCYETEEGNESPQMIEYCLQSGIPVLDVTSVYQSLQDKPQTPPNTGLVAITHLLSMGVTELALFGITFYKEPYSPGYFGHGADHRFWKSGSLPKVIWPHKLDVQFHYFCQLRQLDGRIKIDERSLKVIQEPAKS
jgi:hypothetical protein